MTADGPWRPPVPVFRYPPQGAIVFAFRWRTRKQLPERYGEACRILKGVTASWEARARVLVEFMDGFQAATHRGSIRLGTPRLDTKAVK